MRGFVSRDTIWFKSHRLADLCPPVIAGGAMPEWWLEAVLPGVVFSVLFGVWVALPPRSGESDLGSKVRKLIRGR